MAETQAYVPGVVVGSYQLLRPLGRGGMGIVFKARRRGSDELVALKTVLAANPHLLSSIRREVQRLRRLSHPGVVRILEDGTYAGLPWYAMELLEGGTLEDELSRRSLPPPKLADFAGDHTAPIAGFLATMAGGETEANSGTSVSIRPDRAPLRPHEVPAFIAVTRKLCDALVYIHGEGVVHRDLKPGNVFLRDGSQPVLVDFGLVLAYSGADGREVLQVDASLAGTVAYMAPEQLNGDLVDARADIFALGCMLYEGLTGRLPFPATLEARMSCGFSPPPRPSLLGPAVGPRLDELVLRMLAPDRRERLGHASDVSSALAKALSLTASAADAGLKLSRSYLYRASFAGRSELLGDLGRRARRLHLGTGELVLLSGESGGGKTRLLSEFLRLAVGARLHVVASECPPIAATPGTRVVHLSPLMPLRPLLQGVADLCRTDGMERSFGHLTKQLQVLAFFEPALAELPGMPPLADLPPLPAEGVKLRVLTAAAEVIVALSRRAPLLLLFDDLQWADDLTLDLLAHLAAEVIGRAPVMVVGAFRTEETPEAVAAIAGHAGVTQLTLGRLSEEAVARLIADMLAVQTPPAELVSFVAAHAAGNPFFISEYLHTIVDEGLLLRSGSGDWALADAPTVPSGSWLARLQRLELPQTLRAIVERRLRRLEAPLGDVVALAALLGREVDAELLSELCALDEHALADALNEVLRRQILETAGGGRYRFTHDKLREAAYEAMTPERRRTLHRAAAEALERRGVKPTGLVELANHFSKAAIPRKALEYLRRASEQALAAGAHQQAVPLLARALEHAAAPECQTTAAERASLHRMHSDALFGTGELERSALHAEAALAELDVPIPKTTGRWVLMLLAQLIEQLLRIRREPSETSASPPAETHRLELAISAGWLSSSYVAAHHPQLQVMTTTFLAANLADRAGPRGPRALPYSILGCTAGFLGLKRLSERYFVRARADARRRSDPAAEVIIAIQECALYQGMARWDELRACGQQAAAVAAQVDHRLALEAVSLILGGGELLTGQLAAAASRLSEIVRASGSRGARLNHGWSSTLMGLHALWCGHAQAARELAAAARQDFAGDRGTALANALAVEAGAALLLGERSAALAAAREGVRVLGTGPVLFQLWPACTLLTWTLLELWEAALRDGSPDAPAVRKSALAACRFIRSLGRMCAIGIPLSLRAEGVAERIAGKRSRAIARLEQAIRQAERLGMPIAAIEASIELGRTLPAGSERRPQLLLGAQARATAVGCALLAERARALLEKKQSSSDSDPPI